MSGHLEVITGPMYAGKSEELIRRLRRAIIGKQDVIVFKPEIDNRYAIKEVMSHNGDKFEAYPVKYASDIYSYFREDLFGQFYEVVGIDEVQFFDSEIIDVVDWLQFHGSKVIVTGLDMDFRKRPFGVMPDLLAISKFVIKLRSVCQVCGQDAMYTQRLVNGEPAPLDGDTIVVGGAEQYEARCENCWRSGSDSRIRVVLSDSDNSSVATTMVDK